MNRVSGPTEDQLSAAIACLRRCPEIAAAYLHGSAARDVMHPASDIDLALLLQPGARLPAAERLALAGDLELIFARPVDLGLLSSSNLVYASQVAAFGRLLFTTDTLQSDRFIAQALAQYAELQTARRPVLERYAA